jgi:hypothetical protein
MVVQGIPYDGELTALQLGSRKFVRYKLAFNVVPIDVGHGFILLSDGVVLDEQLQKTSVTDRAVAIASRGCALTVGRDGIAKETAYLPKTICAMKKFRWPGHFIPAPESSGAWAVSADHRRVALITDDGVQRVWTFVSQADTWPLRMNLGTIQSFRSRGREAVIGGIEAIGLLREDSRTIVIHPQSGLGVLDAALLPDGRVLFGATDAKGRGFLGVDSAERGSYVVVADWRRVDVARFVNGPKGSVLVEGAAGTVYNVAPTCFK